ncbi:MAG: lysophospholipid acyltransferase family protein [Opitutaceae bacterium]|nr:lysophospholipid acyltransferase family protein [Opitutaceae bacterium]
MPRQPDHLAMTPFFGFFHYVVRCCYDAFFRGEVVGVEHLPRTGPFIIAANHASHLDPFFIGGQAPRQMRFFARKTLWTGGIISWWLDSTESIPVDRDGRSDTAGAVKRVLQTLRANRGLILFPEGTRTLDGRLQKAKPGIGFIASRSGVPVVPCRIYGSFEAFGKGRVIPRLGTPISIVFGPALSPAQYDEPSAGKDRAGIVAARIMQEIAALSEPEFAVI